MRVPRLYFESALKIGSVIELDSDSTHYLSKVLRLKSTNQIKLFNGSEGEFLGSITAKSNDSMTVSVDSHVRKPVDDKIKFHLALAITKGERMDYAIQKSVELGVFTIIPFFSAFSEVVIKDKKRAMHARAPTARATRGGEESYEHSCHAWSCPSCALSLCERARFSPSRRPSVFGGMST